MTLIWYFKVLIHEWRDWDVNEDNGVDYEEMKPVLEEKANINVFEEKFKLLMSQLDENGDGMVDRVGTFENLLIIHQVKKLEFSLEIGLTWT